MRNTITAILWTLRVSAIVQLVSGILFWTGHAITFRPFHMVVGSLVVLGVWAIAVMALVTGVRRGLALFELVWGLALAVFGAQQMVLLIGSLHWIIRIVHIAMAFSTMELGGNLGKAIQATLPGSLREREPAAG
ncbi:MAG TPA: hypothetical protein VGM82_09555 [Gemmatimonadaceae bacterium]|jgi:hypothetical protein